MWCQELDTILQVSLHYRQVEWKTYAPYLTSDTSVKIAQHDVGFFEHCCKQNKNKYKTTVCKINTFYS